MRSDLTRVAASWSAHMAATGVLQHNPQLASAITNWRAVGENVGDGPSIHDLDAAFMASPKHRANILDPSYDDIGISTVTRSGMIWITVDFRDVDRPEPTTRAASHHVATVARSSRATGSMLWFGASGSAVRLLQRRLHVTPDGIFGLVTRRAVKTFQQRSGLVVDGIVGPRTRAALDRHRAVKAHSVARRCSGLSLRCIG
jgi:peptidoglycan hydrolase-like protein with peptidoglycan-binding domain